MRTPPRILIVDDSEVNVDIVHDRLALHGYELLTAGDGAAALSAVREHEPDLVLLDVMMPGIDGLEVSRQIKADPSLPFIPIILVTALADSRDIVAGLDAGGDEYVTKPIDHAALVARVKSMLRLKSLHDTVREQADRLEEWNRTLERRVQEQVGALERLARLDAELAVARDLQISMLPTEFPPMGGGALHVHAVMHPARHVGGDLYDVFPLGRDVACVVIGDVCDKGMPAALFMARTKTLIRSIATLSVEGPVASGPEAIVATVNDELCRDNASSMFVTLFFAVVALDTGRLTFVNAGHDQPYLLRRGGEVRPLTAPPARPLGISPGFRFETGALTLAPGDALFLFTDGVTEAVDAAGHLYSRARLEGTLRSAVGPDGVKSPADLIGRVIASVQAFAGGTPQADDLTALAAHFRP